MRSLPENPLASAPDVSPLRPEPPAWVGHLFAEPRATVQDPGTRAAALTCCRGGMFTLVSGVAYEPAEKATAPFADAVASLYRSIGRELSRQNRHAVRIWNFVPDIQGPIPGAGDRYMAFNLGRFAAYCDWFGGPESFQTTLPTSSAVGVSERAVWVHVLAADAPGTPVENPRQIPSYRYSRRYGVRPPCFARATKVGSSLLIGGTASILGEQSRHAGDIRAQTRETFENLAALITAAFPSACRKPLESLQSLRVHVRDAQNAPVVQTLLDQLAPEIPDVEFVQAALCRKELLLEIEGVAGCPMTR
jgi:chorismate lyase/3-hydroxybenzoate synthase